MDLFFAQYQGFNHRHNMPFFDEFDRMCEHLAWDVNQASVSFQLFRIALVQEFNYIYGEDENNLLHWKKMFKIIGIPEPATLQDAQAVCSLQRETRSEQDADRI
jgi:hypothetical protein